MTGIRCRSGCHARAVKAVHGDHKQQGFEKTRMLALQLLFAAGLASSSPLLPVAANPVRSAYTTLDLKVCQAIKQRGPDRAWLCEGLSGIPVYLAAKNLRHFVSATQTLGAANSVFSSASTRATIEWRFDRRGEQQVPYAMIIRFHTSQQGKRGEVLVVYKVSAAQTCHAAHIDALANDQAIALARTIADGKAKTFDCSRDPVTEGASGRSPM
jgi:hypothetical protein